MRTPPLVAALTAGGLLLAGCDRDAPELESPVTTCLATTSVTLLESGFVPACVIVAPGATVLFRNYDTSVHMVASNAAGDAFSSELLAPGQEHGHTFRSTAGKVYVYCPLHPWAVATVIIE
ncbi:MAG TPA: hypothetical protein VFL83_10130 [Anaeromyxobacter sp.]|nr:hypothetical protein [Anaeromyxobacter sp.]